MFVLKGVKPYLISYTKRCKLRSKKVTDYFPTLSRCVRMPSIYSTPPTFTSAKFSRLSGWRSPFNRCSKRCWTRLIDISES